MILFLALVSASAGADAADIYSGWAGAFSGFEDPNTGLTVFPTLLVPMGGMAEGMGTAYTAMAHDSGFIEFNPSASALLKETELSFYHHSWIADSSLEGIVYTVRFDDLGVGVGGKFLYVPFTQYNSWGVSGAKDYITETIATLNVSYNLFSSYYFSGVAIGGNVKAAYRSIPAAFAINQSSLALMTDLGVQTSFDIPLLKFYTSQTRNFSVGVVVKNLGIAMQPDESLPLLATTGIAWSPLRPWLLALDINYPFSLPGGPTAEKPSLALGTTVKMTEFLSLQGGVLMKASNPRVSLGASLEFGTMSITVNYNLDLSGSLNPIDKFSAQAKFDLGDFGRSARKDQAERLYLQGVEEFAAGNYEKALAFWRAVLEIDPKYIPASENIRTVEQTINLQSELEKRGSSE
jgi:tetratricopeptide (TPR) repeat protein